MTGGSVRGGAPPAGTRLRRQMVETLSRSGAIRTDALRQAFLAEARENFLSETSGTTAGWPGGITSGAIGLEDVYRPDNAVVTASDRRGIPISASSSPDVMAPMLEALRLQPGARVLEIGAGTGYNAALLARLVEPDGCVTTVEVDRAFAERARGALKRAHSAAQVVVGDGRAGWPKGAPFDRIIVTASSDTIFRAWRDQLRDGGLLVVPFRFQPATGPQAILVLRREADLLSSIEMFGGSFMPLRATGEADSPLEMIPVITASGAAGDLPTPLVSIIGASVLSLPAASQRRLLRTVLTESRPLGRVTGDRAQGLDLFLALHPSAVTVGFACGRRTGTGVISDKGAGFAAVTSENCSTSRVEAWGADSAERRLRLLIDEWRSLGRPRLADFAVVVSFDGSPAVPPWRRIRTSESLIDLSVGT